MTQVHDIYNTINLHSLTYRKLFMQSRLSSLSKQKEMIKDDFNVSWYEVSATNLKNLTPELVIFSQSTTQQVGILFCLDEKFSG